MSYQEIKYATENIKKFSDVEVMDFEEWYRELQASMDAWAINKDDRYKAVVLSLDSKVLTRIMSECRAADSLPKELNEAWLVGELRKRFAYHHTALKRLQEFLERKKQRDETLSGYMVIKRQLFMNWVQLWKEDKNNESENGSMFLEAVIDGFPKSIQATMKLKHPVQGRNFMEVQQSARDLQGSELGSQQSAIASKQMSVVAPQKRKDNKDAECFHCGEVGHMKWQCPKLKEEKSRYKSGMDSGKKTNVSLTQESHGTRYFAKVGLHRAGKTTVVDALIDSGATSTVVSKEVALRISSSEEWGKALSHVSMMDGTIVKPAGRLVAKLTLGNGIVEDCPMVIVEGVADGVLLGANALKALSARMDYGSGELVVKEGSVWINAQMGKPESGPELCQEGYEVPQKGQEENEGADLSDVGPVSLAGVLEEMKMVFDDSTPGGVGIGSSLTTRHHIPLKSNEPVVEPLRRTSLKQVQEIDRQVEVMLKQGVIERTKSEYASPVVLARKKDGSWRFCVDYRKLNEITEKDRYPLPRIDDILDQLRSARLMSKIDLRSGYWQIPVAEEDRHKTAFRTKKGTFRFIRMPFGLTGAPATFQRAMDECLETLIGKTCFVYLDDIVIFSNEEGNHARDVLEVLMRLKEAGFTARRDKCTFGMKQIQLLGHLVGNGELLPDSDKVKAVMELEAPRNAKGLRSFLGSVGYFRRFIEGFAGIAFPLTELIRKEASWKWEKAHQTAFELLRGRLSSAPILKLPDFGKSYVVRSDASDYATGAVLLQEQEGELMPIAFFSKKLTKAEKNYTTTEKEALAVVRAIKEWWFYLDGVKFIVETDHSALRSVLKTREPTGRIARWVMRLQELDFEVRHRPGKQMELPDMLSRMESTSHDHVAVASYDGIASLQRRDKVVGGLVRALEGEEQGDKEVQHLLRLTGDKLVIDDGVLLYSRGIRTGKTAENLRLVVPEELRKKIIYECHDSLVGGHFGTEKTYFKVAERYWWPNQYADVKHYVETCDECARAKKPKWKEDGTLVATVVGAPWERVSADFLGPVSRTTQGNRYLLVFTDYFTRWVVAVPTADCTAETVAQHFVEKIVLQFGAPRELLSDNGPAFASAVVEAVCNMVGTRKLFTTAYRPQANGMVERWNGTVVQSLAACMDEFDKDWDLKVISIPFAFNTARHSATKMTAFELNFGRKAKLPVELAIGPRPADQRSVEEYSNDLLVQLQDSFRIAREEMNQSKQAMERRQNRGGEENPFKVDDQVWLENRDPGASKFAKKYDGPYQIARIEGVNYVVITLEDGKEMKVHVNRIKKYKSRKDASEEENGIQVIPIPLDEEEVEPDFGMTPGGLVGKRVRIYWSGDDAWYDGTVVQRKKRQHVVNYDDGEVRTERLLGYKPGQRMTWKLLVRRGSAAAFH